MAETTPHQSLHLLGTGTSQGVPVIGCQCATCRSTNPHDKRLRSAALFAKGPMRVAIDAGPDFRQQMLQNDVKRLDALLLTHEHNDHVAGLDDVRPFVFRQKQALKVFGLPRVLSDLQKRFAYAFLEENRYPGVPRLELCPIEAGQSFRVGDMTFEAIPVMHGQLPILGYRLGRQAYLTDVKTLSSEALSMLAGLDSLVISSLQPGEHHSHLSLDEALALIARIAPRHAYLTHLSHRFAPVAEWAATLPDHVTIGYDGLMIS